MSKKPKSRTIGVVDFETDPFQRGRLPKPFCCGLYVVREKSDTTEETEYKLYWEKELGNFDSEMIRLINVLANIKGYIYAHNGGKFDFHYILKELLRNGVEVLEIKFVNGRIAKLRFGLVTLLDSWLLLPLSLKATGEKLDFEYWKTEACSSDLTKEELKQFKKDCFKNDKKKYGQRSPREFYRKDCEVYLKQDCKGLCDIIKEFIALYGFGLTLASRSFAAIKQSGYDVPRRLIESNVSMFGDFERLDNYFRQWFFGGRVQCFKTGHIKGKVNYYDINSAYPFAMTKNHWYGDLVSFTDTEDIRHLTKAELAVSMLTIECVSCGAFPIRDKHNGINFHEKEGTFNVTGHEFIMAKKLGLISKVAVLKCHTPINTGNFGKFVRTVHKRKNEASEKGDTRQRLIHKLVMNSGYGRLAIDPRDWMDHKIIDYGTFSKEIAKEGWRVCESYEELGIQLLERQTSPSKMVFHNVAIAASITGYVRSMLMEAILAVEEPIYCDTDSIICKGNADLNFGPNLGEWELEASGGKGIHIAGKKLYAMNTGGKNEWKTASKGVKLDARAICKVAQGEEQIWRNYAPTFNMATFEKAEKMIEEKESLDFRKIFIERKVNLSTG